MVLRAARRHHLPHVLVVGNQPDCVLLPQQQIRQTGRDRAAVVVLVQRPVAVVHRVADVHHQLAAEVGLGLVLLDVELVGLGPHLPVEVAQVVARGVIAMLDEFDGMPEERAFVHA